MESKNMVQSAIDAAYFPDESEKYLLMQKITRRLNSSGERGKKRKFYFVKILSFSVLSAMAIAIFLFTGIETGIVDYNSGKTKKLTAPKPVYQFKMLDSSVNLVFLQNATNIASDDQYVLEYKLTFQDAGKRKFNRGSDEFISFDITAKKGLRDFMTDYHLYNDTIFFNSNMHMHGGFGSSEDGNWHYQMQYEIKKGTDPQLALKHARDALVVIQVGDRIIQKIDLSTLKSYSLNIHSLTQQQRVERMKLREGIQINRSQDFITMFAGKNYTELKNHAGENVRRYDFGAVNDYKFKVSPYKADIKGLKEGKLKKQIYYTINDERNVKSITVFYLNEKDKKVHRYYMSSKKEEDVALKY